MTSDMSSDGLMCSITYSVRGLIACSVEFLATVLQTEEVLSCVFSALLHHAEYEY